MENIKEFAVMVLNGIASWLPEDYKDTEIRLDTVIKNNDLKLTGLIIKKNGSNIAPTIYLEPFYEKYLCGSSLSDVLKEIAELRVESDPCGNYDMSEILDFENCRDKIFPRIVSRDMNTERLKERPYMTVADLAIVFVIVIGEEKLHTETITINNHLMNTWGITAEELQQIAMNNLANAQMGTFQLISDAIMEIMSPDLLEFFGGDRELAEQMFQDCTPEGVEMYVVSTKNHLFGATILLDKDFMQRVIAQIGQDFYILPSSVHECLLITSEEKLGVEQLRRLVRSVNEDQLPLEDRLSDQVYRYTAEAGLMLA